MSPRDLICRAVDLIGGQRALSRAMGMGDDGRDVRRWVLGEAAPSPDRLKGARTALETRLREIEAALRAWPE